MFVYFSFCSCRCHYGIKRKTRIIFDIQFDFDAVGLSFVNEEEKKSQPQYKRQKKKNNKKEKQSRGKNYAGILLMNRVAKFGKKLKVHIKEVQKNKRTNIELIDETTIYR